MREILIVLIYIIVGIVFYITTVRKRKESQSDDFPKEDDVCDDIEDDENEYISFDYLTVSEQFAKAKESNDNLLMMQQLISDLSYTDADNQIVIQISWTDPSGKQNTYDLYCDGMNTASECFLKIAEREAHDIGTTLSAQCRRLSKATEGSDFYRKIPYAARKIFENPSGECVEDDNESLSDVWETN